MDNDILKEITKLLVETKYAFPLNTRQDHGKTITTDVVHMVDIPKVMQILSEKYNIERK